MDLIHFSAEPTHVIRSMPQHPEPSFKPQGFWVSDEGCEDSWKTWCETEEFALDRLTYRTRVYLRPDHQVCILDTVAAILRFTDDYSAYPDYMQEFPWRERQGYSIDWACVAKDYQGLIITPYQWGLRLHHGTFWYYGWDVAGGCIWDASAVERLEYLGAGE